VILGIISAIIVPKLGTHDDLTLSAAARRSPRISYAQTSHLDTTHVVRSTGQRHIHGAQVHQPVDGSDAHASADPVVVCTAVRINHRR
jgi:hypothetical protein